MNIVYAREAEDEISEATGYLIGATGSLAVIDDLRADVARAERLIMEFPNSSPPLGRGMRRCLLSRYSYQLVYRVEGETVHVYAFAHLKRRPNYWRKRVPPPA